MKKWTLGIFPRTFSDGFVIVAELHKLCLKVTQTKETLQGTDSSQKTHRRSSMNPFPPKDRRRIQVP
jgi:hypothetical protein